MLSSLHVGFRAVRVMEGKEAEAPPEEVDPRAAVPVGRAAVPVGQVVDPAGRAAASARAVAQRARAVASARPR